MKTYNIPVTGKGVKKHHIIYMHLMAGLLMIIMGAITWAIPNKMKGLENLFLNTAGIAYLIAGILLIIATIAFSKKIAIIKNSLKLRIVEIILLLPVLAYSVYKQWYLPAAYAGIGILGIIYALYWEKTGNRPVSVTLDEEGVSVPSFKNSFIEWKDIKRLLVRHNVVTIDCENNKLFQLNIDTAVFKEIPQSVEEFALENINKNKHKYKENEW